MVMNLQLPYKRTF